MKERYSKQAIAEMQSISAICRKKRTAMKIRQYILAERLGISRATITTVELLQKMPELRSVLSIMSYLDIQLIIGGIPIFKQNTEPHKVIAQLCKARRKELKINQGTLADRVGVAKLSMCYFETSKQNPKISLVLDTMRYLGLEYQVTTEYPEGFCSQSPEEVIQKLQAYGVKIKYVPFAMMPSADNKGTKRTNIYNALLHIQNSMEK